MTNEQKKTEELEISARDIAGGYTPESTNLIEHYCVRCGKIFFPTPMWVYKDNKGRYCSWTCFNHRNDDKKPRWQAVECLYSNGEYVCTFQSATKAAEWVGTTTDLIKRAINNETPYKGYLWRYKK